MASSRCVPAAKSAGTMNSTLATPVASAVTGDRVIGSENRVRLTCSPGLNPEKMTLWVPPATIVGEAMFCGIAVPGGVLGGELDVTGAAKVTGTALSSVRIESSSLAVYSEHLLVTQ